MAIIDSTVFVAIGLLPGAASLAIARSPKARVIKRSGLSSRAFGLIAFSIADWSTSCFLYQARIGRALIDPSQGDGKVQGAAELIVVGLSSFPPVHWPLLVVLLFVSVAVGYASSGIYRATIMGVAIHDFSLALKAPPGPEGMTCVESIGYNLRRAQLVAKFKVSRIVAFVARSTGIDDSVKPIGAGYWLVILRAAKILQGPRLPASYEPAIPRVYVDVVQGDEMRERRVGTLYTGAVEQVICGDDGNILSLLLRNASRWRDGKANGDSGGEWKEIYSSRAFAINGSSIRNVSYRLLERDGIDAGDDFFRSLSRNVEQEKPA